MENNLSAILTALHLKIVLLTLRATALSKTAANIDAQIRGAIAEVKNPISGHIVADAIGRITYDVFAKGRDCVIETRKDS